ncbi:MAG: hypothetical protein HN509_13680 [Halobacteriovoraceae bacterium]|jgi:hypothetical protein|nr:hypothetical protein [Halobacteriovoraceae bacterium]MBT5093393.1 hypothetical protein [Halobacteriovoraceae bacterium]
MISIVKDYITQNKRLVLDVFIISNFAFLSLDILYAHAINGFSHWCEWIPLYFSIFAAVVLFTDHYILKRDKSWVNPFISICSIFIGALGLGLHLESQFFQDFNLKALVYTAPLVAPLSYTALGLLLLVNRYVRSKDGLWGNWIIFFAYVGQLGNYLLALCDHAQNGFYFWTEWIPVVTSSLLLAIMPYFIHAKVSRRWKKFVFTSVFIQAFVGVLGFLFHLYAIFVKSNSEIPLVERVLFGAPIMAPLLITNLCVLMLIGMVVYDHQVARECVASDNSL